MSPVLIWFFIGAALIVAELFTPAFIIVFFGIGAWGAAVIAAVWPGLERELVTFGAVTLLSLLLLRQRLVNTFQGGKTTARQNTPEFPHAGRQAEVTRAIVAGEEGGIAMGGQGGSYWRATSSVSIPVGAQVRVLALAPGDELLLVVEPLRPKGEDHEKETARPA